jgi:hypothetical protein
MRPEAKRFFDSMWAVYEEAKDVTVHEKGVVILTLIGQLMQSYPTTKDHFDKIWLKFLFEGEPPGSVPAISPVPIKET